MSDASEDETLRWIADDAPCGSFSVIFECTNETAYFYLYDRDASNGRKIVGAIHV